MDSLSAFVRTTSTPIPKDEARSASVGRKNALEDASSVLQSLFGSSCSSPPNKNATSKKVKGRRLQDGSTVKGTDPVECSWFLNPQSAGLNSRRLSLEQVIKKVVKSESPEPTTTSQTLGVRPVTRSRSLSSSGDLPARRMGDLGKMSFSGVKAVSSPPIKRAQQGGTRREGTPESDAGYGTSLQSGSPDDNLAELVRAMKLRSVSQTTDFLSNYSGMERDSSTLRPKLLSISEQDPAVTQAMKSAPVPSHAMGPNLLSTLLGYNIPTPPLQDVDPLFTCNPTVSNSLERAAKLYRSAASIYEANCTWSGQLPHTDHTFSSDSQVYSAKVFLGGVPWDVSEKCLTQSFRQFGPIRVEWPGRARDGSSCPKGYLYVIFESEGAVASLLEHCTHDYSGGGAWYYRISSHRTRAKEVQIIPWLLANSNFVRCSSPRLDPNKTVFVGALHGMLTAEGLSHVFNDLFGGVIYSGIDTDRHKYPIGSGRVTFNNTKSYMKAVSAAFIEIKTSKFVKKVQVDPYLEDKVCTACGLKQGPYFCRDLACFTYYCRYCWELLHSSSLLQHHKPLMRNTRGGGGAVSRPIEPPGLYMPGMN